jgi:hypothetical protein
VHYSSSLIAFLALFICLFSNDIQVTSASSLVGTYNSIIFGNNTFVAVGNEGKIATSTNGIEWTSQVSGTTSQLFNVAYLNGQFIAVGRGASILTSPDGATWTMRRGGIETIDNYTVSYGNGVYVTMADDGSAFKSSDGIVWDYFEVSQLYGGYPRETIFDGNVFHTILSMGTFTSADGVNWKGYAHANYDSLYSITSGNSNIVKVGMNGHVHMNSMPYNSSTVNTLASVKFLNGKFIAVGNSGTIISSLDGKNWTVHDSIDSSLYLEDIAYGNGTFVAIGNGELFQVNLSSAAPIAMDGTATTNQNRPVSDTLKVSNPNAISGRTFAKASNPQNGTVTIAGDGAYTYMPNTDFVGIDHFTFSVSDGQTASTSATITITVNPVVAAPVSDTENGSIIEPNSIITFNSSTDGATIYYTTDRSQPSINSLSGNSVQVGKVKGSKVVIKAYAVKSGIIDSDVATFTYTISNRVEVPQAFPSPSGEVINNSEIMLSSDTSASVIYYTTDGTIPTRSSKTSNSFIANIMVSGKAGDTFTVKAFAVRSGMTDSAVSTFKYTILSESILDEVASVSGVETGRFYSTDRVITFNKGTATLNNKPFKSGEKVSAEGPFSLHVKIDKSRRSLTIYFYIDKTAPVVTGVKHGAVYESEVAITFNEGEAILNNEVFFSGNSVNTPGPYTLVVTDEASNRTTVVFEIESPNSIVRGAADGGLYSTNRKITFTNGTATLNGAPFMSGQTVKEDGNYELIVTGEDGQVTSISFTIKRASTNKPSIPAKGVSSWAVTDIDEAARMGLTSPVAHELFTDRITREHFAGVAVQLYNLITGAEVSDYTSNPFDDTNNQAVINAYHLGIVAGTSEKGFSPASLITREQLATMLNRVLDRTGVEIPAAEEKIFADRNAFSSYAVQSINFMASIQVIYGMTNDTFGPKDNATIEQAVIMAKRLHEKIVEKNGVTNSQQEISQDQGTAAVGEAFELFIAESLTLPGDILFNKYAIRNQSSITLDPYSAIYVATGISEFTPYDIESSSDRYAGYVVISNQTNEPKSYAPKEIIYSLSNIYGDSAGTVTDRNGVTIERQYAGPYIRIISFDGVFDESRDFLIKIDPEEVVDVGDWITLELKKTN